ncbi:hypothetical protein MT1_1901 [Pseudomonas sp. MT-1]|nr:hypothetical protein MT1_1901 [Pseudomonas sp. MT-1]
MLIEAGFGPSVPGYPHNWRLVLDLRTYCSVTAARTLGGSITDREPAGPFTLLACFRRRRAIANVSAATDRVDLCLSRLQAPSTRTECPIVQAFQGGLGVRGRVCGGAFEDGRQASHWLNIRA